MGEKLIFLHCYLIFFSIWSHSFTNYRKQIKIRKSWVKPCSPELRRFRLSTNPFGRKLHLVFVFLRRSFVFSFVFLLRFHQSPGEHPICSSCWILTTSRVCEEVPLTRYSNFRFGQLFLYIAPFFPSILFSGGISWHIECDEWRVYMIID